MCQYVCIVEPQKGDPQSGEEKKNQPVAIFWDLIHGADKIGPSLSILQVSNSWLPFIYISTSASAVLKISGSRRLPPVQVHYYGIGWYFISFSLLDNYLAANGLRLGVKLLLMLVQLCNNLPPSLGGRGSHGCLFILRNHPTDQLRSAQRHCWQSKRNPTIWITWLLSYSAW